MKKSILIILIITILILISGMVIFMVENKSGYIFNNEKEIIAVSVNESLFLKSLEIDRAQSYDKHVYGMVVPHHDLAGEMISESFSKLKNTQEVKRFVIIGPNHRDKGLAPVITANVDWMTVFGKILNNKLTRELVDQGLVVNDFDNMLPEHSIQVLLPYIKYYFPEAEIVPLAVSSQLSKFEARRLAEVLSSEIDEKTVIVESLDFSHYLTTSQANDNDLITEEMLLNKKFDQLWNLGNDYIDSPYSLYVFLQSMDNCSSYNLQIIDHKNSADYLGGEVMSSTSYFSVIFQ